MTFVFLALAFMLAVVFVGYALTVYAPQSRPAAQLRKWRDQLLRRRRPPPQTVTVIHGGQEVEAPVAHTGETVRVQRPRFAMPAVRSQTLAAAVGIAIGFLAITQIPRLVRSQPDSFIVLVAPFRAADGNSSPGSTVARQLAALIPQAGGEQIVVETLDTAPTTTGDALATMERENADVLISGDVAAGGSSNQPALLPVLIYRPTGTFAPAGWAGYTGRFALPAVYPLASTPVDNQAVLPYLVTALRDYSNGNFTASFDTLGTLANSGVLRPELPRSLRGNMLWASGDYAAAANEYRRAVALQGPVIPSPEAAMLANNLGAILLDANDPEATTAFARAVQLLNGKDMGELRVNLAVQALQNNAPEQAVQSLEQAQHMLPPSTALYLMLAEAYRANEQFSAADDAIQKAASQISSAKQPVLPAWKAPTDRRLNAAIAEEQARLQLSKGLQAHGQLFWALLEGGVTPRPDAPSPDTFATIRAQLEQAVQQTDELAQNWRQQAATEDANHRPVNGRIATGQAQRAATNLREREQLLASTEIELARAQSYTPPQGLAAIWSNVTGARSPVGQARARLERLLATYPNDVEARVDRGRVLLLNDKPDDAEQQFEAVLASGQPEPVYGQVLVVLKKDPNSTDRVQQLLNEALQRNERFYPAREMLADMAARRGDWATAVAQQQILFQQYPTAERRLALGRTLRQGGRAYAIEAENVLLPLANKNNPEALLELGRLYEDNYNYAAAQEALNRASALAPRDPQVAFYLGKALEAQGNPTDAQTQYRLAIAANPKYVDAYLALADLNQGNLPEQARLYRAAIDAGLNNPDDLKRIGNALLKTGDYATAATAFQHAIDANKGDAQAHHGLAQAYLRMNDLDKATVEEQTALQLSNNTYPEAWAGLGDIALARDDANQAIERYQTALQQNDGLVDAYIGLGQAYADKLDWTNALARFQEAVDRSSCPTENELATAGKEQREQCAKAYLWLGEALIRQDKAAAAIEQYNKAITYDPNYPAAYFGLAQAQFANQQTDAALRNVNTALENQPAYAEALLLKGKILESQGQISAAQDSYSQAIQANGKLGEPYYRRGLLRVRNNQLNDAQDDFENAVSAQPNFAEAHYWLGRMYLVNNRPGDARKQFAIALDQRGNTYPEALFYQGIAQQQLGQPAEAITSFQSVLSQAQNSTLAREAEAAIARLKQP